MVSHGHGPLALAAVEDLLACPEVARVVLVRNVPEAMTLPADFRLVTIDNARPRGFGANHNQAFARADTPLFCVVNPDIRLRENPFPALAAALRPEAVGVCGPRVLAPSGEEEDHARHFPTVGSLLRKALRNDRGLHRASAATDADSPDWLAGMFLCFRSGAFRAVGGFDEAFFLYYEDVDICARLRRRGFDVRLCRAAAVIHDARRASRRSLRFLRWHLASMARYFLRHAGRLPKRAA